jgi:dihydroxyacetone kinase-like protein
VDEGAGLPDAMKQAYQAAAEGVEATKNMVAQHGRAAYYQEKSKEAQDPGATVGAMVVKVFADYLNA